MTSTALELANSFIASSPHWTPLTILAPELSDAALAHRITLVLPTDPADPTRWDMADSSEIEWAIEILVARCRSHSLSPSGATPHVHPSAAETSKAVWWLLIASLGIAIWLPLLWFLHLLIR